MMVLMGAVKQSTGVVLDHLDLGGGFPVPTVREFGPLDAVLHKRLRRKARPPDPDRPDWPAFAEAIAAEVTAGATRAGIPQPTVFFEPGRAVTSQAQVLLLGVGLSKLRADGSRIAICDGGRSTNAVPLGNEYHEVLLANRLGARTELPQTIVGGLCTPGDWTFVRKDLPQLEGGDLLAVMDAGAYFTSFANDFAFPRPAIVMVRNGEAQLIRRRERFEDLIAMDEGLGPMPDV
jgi:diaminopimelate decarboxylase